MRARSTQKIFFGVHALQDEKRSVQWWLEQQGSLVPKEIPVSVVGADGDVSMGDAYVDDTDALVVHFAPVGVCGTSSWRHCGVWRRRRSGSWVVVTTSPDRWLPPATTGYQLTTSLI